MVDVRRRHIPGFGLFLLSMLTGLSACSPGEPEAVKFETGDPATETASDLRVMSFNIEWGGARVSFANVIEAIRLSGADVVGIQEAEGNLQRLAGALGWQYDLRNYVISRFPLIAPAGSEGRYVYVEVEPGKAVALANIHLPSDPYGPDAVRDGATVEQVLELEKATRLPAIESYIPALQALVNEGIPVFITGDFNAPSHRDWTDATAGSRKFLDYPVAWPVSSTLEAAGFRDSWRTVYPDPLRHPGLTWWAARPPLPEYAPGENDARDRIDFIWSAGNAEAVDSRLAGEQGGPEVSIGLVPWPSDHRAVISDFRVVPANLPGFVTSERRVYRSGDGIELAYNSFSEAVLSVRDLQNGAPVAEERVPAGRGTWSLPPGAVGAGHYEVGMREGEAGEGPGREFWVLAGGAVPAVEVEGDTFAPGEEIEVRWRDGPGNRNDYLAAYPAGSATEYENGLAWVYTDARPSGNAQIGPSATSWGWPLPPGEYVIRLVKDDGYEVLAESAPFTVR